MKLNDLLKKLINKPESKEVAKKRLKFALVYDKLEVTDNMLENLQKELLEVISRYFEIDRDSMNLDIQRSDDYSALVFNTPIVSAKHQQRQGTSAA
ncbi:MAG TPA: cell division topological specificity factor MinE [Desulfosalsimonadaceae bacterium]|nr:cell division topological specificity factor MinE [Desulfosalsimonadaceae bacterium]